MAKENNFFKMEMLILLILKQGNRYSEGTDSRNYRYKDGNPVSNSL